MIFKVSLTSVSGNTLCHLLRSRKLNIFLLRRRLSLRTFNSFILLNYKIVTSGSRLKMSNNASSSALFCGKGDRFEGITVFSDREPCDIKQFPQKLKNSLEEWMSSKKRGIWFKVHLDQSEWVPVLVKNGFKYHHAKEDYVMLYLWLPTHESNNIPNYAHTMVGVGAVVVNECDQVLVVKEKYFNKLPMWKLPGGYVEPGENIVDAAIREVLEETGIKAEFQSILTLRQTHHGMFGCSDIYIVVNLRALSGDIQKCDREIAECQWMDIEEYLNHSNIHELNRFFVTKLLYYRKRNIKIDCHHGVHQVLQKPYTVYSVVETGDDKVVLSIPLSSVAAQSSKST